MTGFKNLYETHKGNAWYFVKFYVNIFTYKMDNNNIIKPIIHSCVFTVYLFIYASESFINN